MVRVRLSPLLFEEELQRLGESVKLYGILTSPSVRNSWHRIYTKSFRPSPSLWRSSSNKAANKMASSVKLVLLQASIIARPAPALLLVDHLSNYCFWVWTCARGNIQYNIQNEPLPTFVYPILLAICERLCGALDLSFKKNRDLLSQISCFINLLETLPTQQYNCSLLEPDTL